MQIAKDFVLVRLAAQGILPSEKNKLAASKQTRNTVIIESAHGARKVDATRAANAGATVAELEAMSGWPGGAMASLYTRAADPAGSPKAPSASSIGTPDQHSIPAPW
jgi:hypothetical protein